MHDILTNLEYHVTEFEGSYAHKGFVAAANDLDANLTNDLTRLATEHPDYRVVVVGHSLGAGAGLCLAHRWWNENRFPGLQVVAFAPPACLSPALARQAAAYSTSLVFGDDLVPRLSARSVAFLLYDLDCVGRAAMGTLKDEAVRLGSFISGSIAGPLRNLPFNKARNNPQAPFKELVSSTVNRLDGYEPPVLTEKQSAVLPELTPPENCVYLARNGRQGETTSMLWRPAADTFQRIVVSERSFLDHTMARYTAALSNCQWKHHL